MAISIDWGTKVIFVPKADMTLVQSAPPIEVRELDLNVFRLVLKDLEDSEEGMCFLDTHNHNTEVMLGTLTLARVVEIINGYTVTFEDGQYAVNLVGANSNIMDVLNPNQVSVRSNNSAGLIDAPAAEIFAEDIEEGISFKQSQRLVLAALAGCLAGADPGSTTITISNAKSGAQGTKNRIVATVDQYGNRSLLTFDLTD